MDAPLVLVPWMERELPVLCAWGRVESGPWWGLIAWCRWACDAVLRDHELWCSGWLPAGQVQQRDDLDQGEVFGQVLRIGLDPDPRWWPAPPGGWTWHYGRIAQGMALEPPAGASWSSRTDGRERRRPQLET